MGKGGIASYYSGLSREDRRTFDRWLKANAIVGAIFATGLIVMALTGSRSVAPRDAEAASSDRNCCMSPLREAEKNAAAISRPRSLGI